MNVSRTISSVKNRKTGEVSKTRYLYDCGEKECGHQFSATTGTLFHDSHLPLQKWFLALALYCNAKKSLSAKQLQRDLGVAYRTAWYLGHRIRKAMESGPGDPLTGIIEVDETHVTGRYEKRRKREPWQTQAVMGLLERGKDGKPSQVQAFPIRSISKIILTGAVRDRVSTDAEMLCTDQHVGYKSLGKEYRHEVVNHIRKEYARRSGGDLITTNGIENFWSLFKRGLVGSFHSVSVKHLPRYLDEFTYRTNRRGSDAFPETVTRLTSGRALPYRELTATEE